MTPSWTENVSGLHRYFCQTFSCLNNWKWRDIWLRTFYWETNLASKILMIMNLGEECNEKQTMFILCLEKLICIRSSLWVFLMTEHFHVFRLKDTSLFLASYFLCDHWEGITLFRDHHHHFQWLNDCLIILRILCYSLVISWKGSQSVSRFLFPFFFFADPTHFDVS